MTDASSHPKPDRYVDLEDTSVQDMKEFFALFDFEGTGHIATEDLGTVLRGLGKNLTEKQIGDFINTYDQDSSGKLDFGALYSILAGHGPMRPTPTEEEVLRHFQVFDTYKNGKISCPDLVTMLLKMGEPLTESDVEHLMQEISIDGDGLIDIREFVQFMFATSLATEDDMNGEEEPLSASQ